MNLQNQQRHLTDHIRDPERNPGPPGMEARRLNIYRELFYNNIEGFISSAFPVLRAIYSDEAWHAMVRDFLRIHRCRTPYFLKIAEEFIDYLQRERGERPGDPPFLAELAHYEWVELALDVAETPVAAADVEPDADLLTGLPVLSELAWPLVYRFAVHRIGPAYQPAAPDPEPTFLVVYRAANEQVKFLEINAATARMLALLQEPGAVSGADVLRTLAQELQHPEPQRIVDFGLDTLRQLRDQGIVLGVRSDAGN